MRRLRCSYTVAYQEFSCFITTINNNMDMNRVLSQFVGRFDGISLVDTHLLLNSILTICRLLADKIWLPPQQNFQNVWLTECSYTSKHLMICSLFFYIDQLLNTTWTIIKLSGDYRCVCNIRMVSRLWTCTYAFSQQWVSLFCNSGTYFT